MLYLEQDRREIRSWIKNADDKVREDLQAQIRNLQGNFISAQQLAQYDAEFQSRVKILVDNEVRENNLWATEKITAVQKTFDDFKANDFDILKNSSAAVSEELAAFKKQLAQHEQNFAAVAKALNDIQKNFIGLLHQRDAQILSLKAEIDALTKKIADIESPPTPLDEERFFLPAQDTAFLPADRKEIPAKLKEALNLGDAENFLGANPSSTSKQFQKLLTAHLKEVKRFVDKLKLDDLDDEELSETVTAKFFKLFQRTIFDNLIIAITRGLKSNNQNAKDFYANFLDRLNEYLTRCGIYSINVKPDRQAEAEDYENMTPQIIKTDDAALSEKINSIERLPYRINYLDEFGEQKFFQYSGIMSVYKAV